MNKSREKWSMLGIKDQIQYITAIILILSGVVIAFLSFFLNSFNIATGVLIYIAQAFTAGGAIFGVSIYFKNQLIEAHGETMDKVKELIEKVVKEHLEDKH